MGMSSTGIDKEWMLVRLGSKEAPSKSEVYVIEMAHNQQS